MFCSVASKVQPHGTTVDVTLTLSWNWLGTFQSTVNSRHTERNYNVREFLSRIFRIKTAGQPFSTSTEITGFSLTFFFKLVLDTLKRTINSLTLDLNESQSDLERKRSLIRICIKTYDLCFTCPRSSQKLVHGCYLIFEHQYCFQYFSNSVI